MTASAFPPAPDLVPVRRALISVSDKTGLIETAQAMAAAGVELVSTGGTRAAIAAAVTEHGIGGIDLLYMNLYPFEATVARGAGFAECVENIDIGGPAKIRSA